MSYEVICEKSLKVLKACGRTKESLKILAVSKLQPIEKIKDLYERGQRAFGENYVQEALGKQEELKFLDIEWHFIGSLQKNKVKNVIGRFALIHSVDSLKLAETLSRHRGPNPQRILLQVNVAQEESKGGFDIEELSTAWPQLQELPGLEIAGLMTMPPLTEEAEQVRPYFRRLKQLQAELQSTGTIHPLKELSMGTSHDYHIAIEEGATIVRLGTVLFGERNQHRTQS